MADPTQVIEDANPEPERTPGLEERLRRDEDRLRADEARLTADEARMAADEKVLRTNRLVARIAEAAARAQTAETAGNAGHLGGVNASGYVSKITVVRAESAAGLRAVKGPLAARCPSGTRIISGGAAVDGTSHGVAIARSAPNSGEDWVAVANAYHRPTVPWRLIVTAVCVSGGGSQRGRS